VNNKTILFVGPLPPPVHGFSEINRRMLARLQANSRVDVFDTTPKDNHSHLVKLWFAFVGTAFCRRGGVLYLPLSGGFRQIIDASFAAVAMLFGFRIFVHHHSFAYLNKQPLYTRLVLWLLNKSIHVVLCDRMAEMLSHNYTIPASNVRVISNAAFLSDIDVPKDNTQKKEKLVLGFLSNITAAKGCFDFIALLKATMAQDLAVEGIMAGPVQSDIQNVFDDAVREVICIKHVGAVYGEEKNAFFAKIDLLVFPTRYENEAEPVTIWESMGAGVPVISLSRGCISGMVSNKVGWVIQNPDTFVEKSLEVIHFLLANDLILQAMKLASRIEFEKSKLLYTNTLNALVAEIHGGLI